MTILNQIISTFSVEEQQKFTAFLERRNKRKDAKNIQLFRLLSTSDLGTADMIMALYGESKRNAYHALRKRLYQATIDFIVNQNLEEENSNNIQLIKLVLASKTFLQHKQYQVAFRLLDKAEATAKEHHLFSVLNEIYGTQIQFAHADPMIDLDALIKKYKNNQKQLLLEDELNLVYAKIRRVLIEMTYKGEIVAFETILNKTLEQHNIGYNASMSFKSLYQLMAIVSFSAFATNDYLNIEPFLMNTYVTIEGHKHKEKQLFYHIQVLYLISNTLFRNKKFEASLKYLRLMEEQMLLQQRKYYNTFKLKYHLLKALNYNYGNRQEKAILLLEKFIVDKHPDIESLLDIYLGLVTFYFQKGAFKKAHGLFAKFYHSDKWYTERAGKEWVIKKALIEILLHIELGNDDLVASRLTSFKRAYYAYLRDIDQERVITYMSLIEDYFNKPEDVYSQEFKLKVETSFDWVDAKQEDIFVMSFYAWLKSKMERTSLFPTTLELVHRAQNIE